MDSAIKEYSDAAGEFAPAVHHLVDPAIDTFAKRLAITVPDLDDTARAAVIDGARLSTYASVRLKVNRLLLLELHAARMAGRLAGETPAERWDAFVTTCTQDHFWSTVDETYPALRPRLTRVIANRADAVLTLAQRFVADRHRLDTLLGGSIDDLVEVRMDAGDSHRGGQTVAWLRFAGSHGIRELLYKPRSLAVDRALGHLLTDMAPDGALRVPEVIDVGVYGWARQVPHTYCLDDAEESQFYRAMGGWLAIMRLLGGSDLHAENVIAAGPVPYVVDCETLFTPDPDVPTSPLGLAFDRAAGMIRRTALRTGLLPWRQTRLGMQGVDISAVGALPGQQPRIPMPVIVGAGTDEAHMAMRDDDMPGARNHPTPVPHPERHWDGVVDGFYEYGARITMLDDEKRLRPALDAFNGCAMRVVPRATQAYVEVARMLWHPASLADEVGAVARAQDVLLRHGAHAPGAPDTAPAVAAEIEDLLLGDIPVFTFTPDEGRVVGPGEQVIGDYGNLIDAFVADWQRTSLRFEETMIRTSLVGAYLNQGNVPSPERLPAEQVDVFNIDARRRAVNASLVRQLASTAVWGDDATVTWIGPVLTSGGWVVRALSPDLYSGQAGMIVALEAYAQEIERGAADAVPDVRELVDAAIPILVNAEEAIRYDRVGAFTGAGSGIWTWLYLHRMRGQRRWLNRATALAEWIPSQLATAKLQEVLAGLAGTIVPLIALAERTGDAGYLEPARQAAGHLADQVRITDGKACWPSALFPDGIGGFAHGVTGISWSLTRLGIATGEQRWLDLAEAGYRFEESLWRPEQGNWQDIREAGEPQYLTAWCHGATGIGLAGWDIYRRLGDEAHLDVARRGAAANLDVGFGWSHTLCHGDMGAWELVDRLATAHALETDIDRTWLVARILSSMEQRGALAGLSRGAFSPGLMSGLAGMVYQLLRFDPESQLPSILLLES